MRRRPQDTLHQLVERFPAFEKWWSEENAPPEDGLVNGIYYTWSHHSVMAQFLQFAGFNLEAFTESELRWLGVWINEAVSVNDDLENAVATCFLEHAEQVSIDRMLVPYLSPEAKERLHA